MMKIVRFLEKEIIDIDMEVHYNFITQVKTLTEIHTHDFYEIFLMVYGKMTHHVNNEAIPLEEGSLVFMRPEDVHYYKANDETTCGIINIAFPIKTFNALSSYLGDGFDFEKLIKAKLPPMVVLSDKEKEVVRTRLENLNILNRNEKKIIKMEARILILEFFTKYFSLVQEHKSISLPSWLNHLKNEMQRKENFIQGTNAMVSITSKTPEHLCRVFNKYFNQTPSQFVNDLRLNYAANLLTNSDENILSISQESGFGNLSHFYHQFKKKFNMSPAQFRKLYHKSAISKI